MCSVSTKFFTPSALGDHRMYTTMTEFEVGWQQLGMCLIWILTYQACRKGVDRLFLSLPFSRKMSPLGVLLSSERKKMSLGWVREYYYTELRQPDKQFLSFKACVCV